jgi:hypothetical protein
MLEYGTAELQVIRGDDGQSTVKVVKADERIGVTHLIHAEVFNLRWNIVLDEAGEYRYRQTGESDERCVVFQRVRD